MPVALRYLSLGVLGVLVACGPTPRPPAPPSVTVTPVICQAIWQEELGRPIDPEGLRGCLVQARAGASAAQIRGNVKASEEWAATHAPPSPTVVTLHGVVRAEGAVLLDDDGPRLWLGTTLFWGLWGYQQDRPRLVHHLEWIASRRIDYVRVLVSVGGAFWADRTPNPVEADVAAFQALAASHGLRVQWTIFGGGGPGADTPQGRKAIVERVARVVAANPVPVFAVEVGNELWQNGIGESEARDLARSLKIAIPNLVAVTAPQGDSCAKQTPWYAGVGTLVTLHHDRSQGGEGGVWRPVRQPWRESAFTCPTVARAYANNEGIGPVSSVGSESDPLRLALYAATSWLASEGAFVLHTGAGIKGSDYDTATGHRHADLWTVPGIDAILTAINATRGLLPDTLPNFTKGGSRPSMWTVNFDQVMRVYCGDDGSTFVCLPLNVTAPTVLTATRPLSVAVASPLTGQVLSQTDLETGQTLALTPSLPGVVLRGKFR